MTKGPRLTYFALGIIGGLVAGTGTLLTWRSLDAFGGVTATKGVDALVGIVALVLAVAALVLTLVTRVGDSEEPRTGLVPLVLVAGVVIAAIGLLGVFAPATALGDRKQEDAEKIAEATGASVDEILATMDRYTDESSGPGPLVTALGGLLIVGGGVAGFAWARAWRASTQAQPDGDALPAAGEPAEPDRPETT